MANKRQFKKSLEALTSAVVDEMMASYYNEENADREKIASAISKALSGMGKARQAANKLFGKGAKEFENIAAYNKAKALHTKQKYDDAIADYNDTLSEALKDYNAGMPKNDASKS